MKLILAKGSTSNILQIFIRDSSSTVGAGLTGLVFNSGSLTAYYHRDSDTTATVITLVTMTVGTFTSSGFKEIDATNMPGWYQFCPPNAAMASGANNVGFHLKGATNMASMPLEAQLVSFDPYDSVRLGLTSLPNAAASAIGGLPVAVDTSGRVDVLKINGTSQTARDLGGTLGVAGAGLTSLGDARIANLDATISSRSTYAGGAVASVTAAVTVGTNSDKTGYALTSGEHTNIVADVNTAFNGTEVELAGIPTVSSSLRLKLSAIFQYLLLKRTTTVTTETMYKNDSSTTLGTATVSDDGTTATHGKVS